MSIKTLKLREANCLPDWYCLDLIESEANYGVPEGTSLEWSSLVNDLSSGRIYTLGCSSYGKRLGIRVSGNSKLVFFSPRNSMEDEPELTITREEIPEFIALVKLVIGSNFIDFVKQDKEERLKIQEQLTLFKFIRVYADNIGMRDGLIINNTDYGNWEHFNEVEVWFPVNRRKEIVFIDDIMEIGPKMNFSLIQDKWKIAQNERSTNN